MKPFPWYRGSLVSLALAVLAAAVIYMLWPPSYGLVFWSVFWALWVGLLLALLGLGAGLIKSAVLWRQLAGGVVGLVFLGLAASIGFVSVGYLQMGVSLEQVEAAEHHDDGAAGERTVHLTYLRFHSTADEPGPPIVYLSGGPGGSGVLTALSSRHPLFLAMREVGDVIALDQRGTMPWNDPWLVCPETWDYPLDEPLVRERAIQILHAYVRDCVDYYETYDLDLAAYTTVESAEDLEALREQLGSEKISLWATSYGTHLALAYIRRHSDRLHRVVLHGIEGPDHTLKLPSSVGSALDQVSALAAGTLDLRAAVVDALDRLESQPATVELPDGTSVVVGKFDLQLLTSLRLGSAAGRMSLPSLYTDIAAGDYASVAAFARGSRLGSRASLMGLLMDCASGSSPDRAAQIRYEARGTLLGDAINYPFPEVCEAVPIAPLGPEFRSPVVSSVPALFISGSMDGRTPVANAEEVLRGFPNGAHLIIEGAGHGDELFLSSPQILEVMLDFMNGEPFSSGPIEAPFEFDPIEP